MEVNNFELIANHMYFESPDDFYFLQIIQRPKDGHNVRGNNKNRLIRYYVIKSVEKFKMYEREIIAICKEFNARAYIHPTKRSFKQVAKSYMQNVFENYASEKYGFLGREYSTACGKSFVSSDKKYIIDIDEPLSRKHNEMLLFIERECEPIESKFQYIVPTLNGFHMIVKPFNTAKFIKAYPEVDVHKNNPTLLYYYKN